ncbi:MAG: NRDE family protein [Nitrospirota bacterium]|nr:MAG: NRDE family protein [Nitrospirota bacterium]
MCLLLISYRSHPAYDIILAANRDEFHARPTSVARFWKDEPYILAGRDLQAGGTWLGITRQGRIAAVTNYHEAALTDPSLLSRGALVSDYLRREGEPEHYAEIVNGNGKWYGGFNIILGKRDYLYYCSNRKEGYEILKPGIHGLSNGSLNDNSFKVRRGVEQLGEFLSGENIRPDDLFTLLSDSERAPDHELQPPVGTIEEERFYSPIFIMGADYGTRSSTVIMIDKEGGVCFSERSFSPGGEHAGTVEYEFRIEELH